MEGGGREAAAGGEWAWSFQGRARCPEGSATDFRWGGVLEAGEVKSFKATDRSRPGLGGAITGETVLRGKRLSGRCPRLALKPRN